MRKGPTKLAEKSWISRKVCEKDPGKLSKQQPGVSKLSDGAPVALTDLLHWESFPGWISCAVVQPFSKDKAQNWHRKKHLIVISSTTFWATATHPIQMHQNWPWIGKICKSGTTGSPKLKSGIPDQWTNHQPMLESFTNRKKLMPNRMPLYPNLT